MTHRDHRTGGGARAPIPDHRTGGAGSSLACVRAMAKAGSPNLDEARGREARADQNRKPAHRPTEGHGAQTNRRSRNETQDHKSRTTSERDSSQ